MRGAVVRAACALLTPEQMADVVANRAIVEQAFDLLRTRSQTTNVKLCALARHLTEEFPTRSADERALRQAEYDDVLLTASPHGIAEPT